MSSVEPRSPGWSHKSAFETDLALEEAQKWIEDVTGQKFKSPRFKTSLQDGVLLCRLVNSIKPGIVRKIHQTPGTMFYVENVTFFLEGCKALGLKGSQLFDVSDLQDVPRAREARGGYRLSECLTVQLMTWFELVLFVVIMRGGFEMFV
jgi:hypothetical protein